MSELVDANGDGIYDVLYFPAIANGQFVQNLDWLLYLGTSAPSSDIYTDAININDRNQSNLIHTWAGNDTILQTNAAAAAHIDGGQGIDTAVYSGNRSAFSLSKTAAGFSVSGSGLADTLVNIERLQFADRKLAIDTAGLVTAKILGAVFGKASVANKEYAGIGLQLLDGGMDYATLVQAAINAKLGAGASNTAVVNLLYTNVVGSAPGAADLAFYVDLLNNGTYTAASLGVLAADTALNTVNINLVGLANSGLEYLPQG